MPTSLECDPHELSHVVEHLLYHVYGVYFSCGAGLPVADHQITGQVFHIEYYLDVYSFDSSHPADACCEDNYEVMHEVSCQHERMSCPHRRSERRFEPEYFSCHMVELRVLIATE